MKKTYTKADIVEIIDREIKNTMQLKNEYIKHNGLKHVDTIKSFDSAIATLSALYNRF